MPELSIIIPTHNRPRLLERVVGQLQAQSVDAARYEVLVVDSASSDDTPQAVQRLAARHPNLKAFRTDRPGAAAARNMGLEAARAPLLVLLDDDILAEKDFLARVLAAAGDQPGRVLLGRIVAPWADSTDPFHRFLLESGDVNSYAFKNNDNVPAQFFYTACVAIPREVLGATRFDENFVVYGIEDVEFGLRLLRGGARMVFRPEIEVRHEYFPEFGAYREKKFRTGRSLGYFLENSENAPHFYVETAAQRLYFRFYRIAAAPLAGLACFWERLRKRTGPLNRVLYHWYYRDLRVQMFNGMRAYRREKA